MRLSTKQRERRGSIAPLGAVLIVVLLAMVAFAVDIAWIAASEAELQNAADAAALAGVPTLMNAYVQYNLPGQTQKNTILANALSGAAAQAKLYASYNAAGGVNSLALNDSDIEFGFTDASGNYTPRPTYTGFPNTIKVKLRRDSQANGALSLFFAPVLGVRSTNLLATASATVYGGAIDNFSGAAGILPMAYDVNFWNQFVATGKNSDGGITYDSSGNPDLLVYPSGQYVGNFGLLTLNQSHVGDSTLRAWVANGMSSSDLQALQNANLVPLSAHNTNTWDWLGEPGFQSALVQTVNSYTYSSSNQTYLLPLFQPVNSSQSNYQAGTGQGSHYYYNIVAFVGVKVVSNPNDNRNVYVEPAAVVAPNAVFQSGTIAPVGTNGKLVTTFTPAKLSH